MRAFEPNSSDLDVVVVGGGLAGLSAAALVAQAGRSVILFEQAGDVGGRAATQVRHGISFNLGPHALYFLGACVQVAPGARRTLHGTGSQPGKSRLLTREGAHPLPRGPYAWRDRESVNLRRRGRPDRDLLYRAQPRQAGESQHCAVGRRPEDNASSDGSCQFVRILSAASLRWPDRAERGTGRLMADSRTDVGIRAEDLIAPGCAGSAGPGARSVHEHCRLHGRDAAGAADDPKAGADHESVQPDRRILLDQCRSGGAPGFIDHGQVWAEERVSGSIRGVSSGHAGVRSDPGVPHIAGREGAYRRLRRDSGRPGADDRGRRFSRRTARPSDRRLDVGLCLGLGIWRSRRPATGDALWLARSVPDPGGPGNDRIHRRCCWSCPRSASIFIRRPTSIR